MVKMFNYKIKRVIKTMCIFISTECLTVNALIELSENSITKISFKQLSEYGLMVVEQYKAESSDEAVFIFNPEEIQELTINYPNYFEINKGVNDEKHICLKDGVDIQKLKEQFRWTLSYEMLKALNIIDVIRVIVD